MTDTQGVAGGEFITDPTFFDALLSGHPQHADAVLRLRDNIERDPLNPESYGGKRIEGLSYGNVFEFPIDEDAKPPIVMVLAIAARPRSDGAVYASVIHPHNPTDWDPA